MKGGPSAYPDGPRTIAQHASSKVESPENTVAMNALAPDPALAAARDFLAPQFARTASVGVVLGSGLGAFCDSLSERVEVPFSKVPHMPRARVTGHAGTWCFGMSGRVPVLCQRGRVHLYEGRTVSEVVFGARLLAAMGCHTVLLTNAAGGVNRAFRPGDLMLLVDHINLTARNPLMGFADAFIDMTETYDPGVRHAARTAADAEGIALREGIYAGLLGPSYETPAEIEMLRSFGVDAVGMSTVCESIALRYEGVRVGAMSCITNMAATRGAAALSHTEVKVEAARAETRFRALLGRWIEEIGESS